MAANHSHTGGRPTRQERAERDSKEMEREFELERMILFSDAIFAIAITLMVIDIKWPDIPDSLRGVNLYTLFRPMFFQFIVFVLSFFYIGRSWSQHLKLCRLLRTYDQGLINYNLLYLFFIVIFPFTASGIVGHVTDSFIFPLFLYSFNMAAVAVIHFLILRYILHKKPELSLPFDEAEKKYIYARGMYASAMMVLLFLLTIVIAILTAGNASYTAYVFFLIPLGLRYAGKKANKYKPKTDLPEVMQTARTIWTLLEEKDLPAMTEMAREPDTFRYIRKLQVMTEAEYQQFLLLKLEQIRQGSGYHWAIWLKEDESFIGAVNLNPIGNSDMMQIGCQLKRARWGQGFASELLRRALDFAIEEAGITTVYGVFERDNAVSRRLMEKLGFVFVEKRADQGVEIEIHRWGSRGGAQPPTE